MSKRFFVALLLLSIQQTSSFAQSGPAISGIKELYEGAPRYTGSHLDMSAASDEELIALTDHSNAAVRVEAYSALIKKQHPACFDILLKHLTDVDEVAIEGGCFAASAMVGDIMIDRYSPYLKTSNGLTEKAMLDSVLLYTAVPGMPVLRSRDQLLLVLEPREKFYARVRDIAAEELNKAALIALAKYRKPQDKPLFTSLLKSANKDLSGVLYALSFFPDADFFPHLERVYKKSLKQQQPDYLLELLRTVAAYRHAQSLAFLQKVYQKHRHNASSNYLYAILTATNEHADPLYAGLEAQVKKSLRRGKA